MADNQIVTAEQTPAERTDVAGMLAELRAAGYVDLAEFVYPRSGRRLQVGARIRHRGEQYPEALTRGTGCVVALVHMPESPWSRSYGMPDIELIMLADRERFGSRLSQLGHYHVEVMEPR